MPRIVVGLEQEGFRFKNEVIKYCQVSGNPTASETVTRIYEECLGQIFSKMDVDFQKFMYNMMELPDWRMIHYIDTPIDYTHLAEFRAIVGAFGIMLWHRLNERGNLDARYFYVVESCTTSYAIVAAYINADYA